ncbi:unnamed protein product [Camellia sinensis]
MILPNVEEEPSVRVAPTTEAEPVVEGAENEQVPHVVEVAVGGLVAEGTEPPNPADSVHSDRFSVGGDDFVPKTPKEDRGMRKSLEVTPLPFGAASGGFFQSAEFPLVQQIPLPNVQVVEGSASVAAASTVPAVAFLILD